MMQRAARQSGKELAKDPSEETIRRVMLAGRSSSVAVGLLLERVCDGANLEKPRIRNLLWDQEIAFSIGNSISGHRVVVVTNDAFFKEAAKLAGTESSVCSLSEYLALLDGRAE
jgi:hypothetical protein